MIEVEEEHEEDIEGDIIVDNESGKKMMITKVKQ